MTERNGSEFCLEFVYVMFFSMLVLLCFGIKFNLSHLLCVKFINPSNLLCVLQVKLYYFCNPILF